MKRFLIYLIVAWSVLACIHDCCGTASYGGHEALRAHSALQQFFSRVSPEQQCVTVGAVAVDLQSQLLVRNMRKRAQEAMGHKPTLYELRETRLLSHQLCQCQKFYRAFSSTVASRGQANFELKRCFLSALDAERSQQLCRYASKTASFLDSFVERLEGDFGESVSVQFLGEFIGMMILFFGLSYADQLFSVADQKEQQVFIDQIKRVQSALQDTQRALVDKRDADIAQLNPSNPDSVFNTKVAAIKQAMPAAQAFEQDALRYIQRLININQPTQFFIDTQNAFTLEQRFASSAMLTPVNNYGSTWYNIFGAGNWLYDPDLQAFVQRAVPVGSSFSTTSGISNADDAGHNVIFTEFYTDAISYTIQLELTLINAAFPFCAGLVFNKARWISGNYDRMNTYRFVGLYGDANKKVGLYALQTQSTTNAPIKMLLSGFDQNNQSLSPLYSLSADEVASIGKTPLVYRIKVTTQQDRIDVTLAKKDGTGVAYQSISFNDPAAINQLLFWYHGIGFMAPGCQAAFKLLADSNAANPVNQLVYTPDQIQAFVSRVNSNFASKG